MPQFAKTISDHLAQIVVYLLIVGTIAYLSVYGYLATPFDPGKFTARGVTVAVTIGALASSLLVVVLVMFQPKDWLGEAAEHRFYFALGSLIGTIAAVGQLVDLIVKISTP